MNLGLVVLIGLSFLLLVAYVPLAFTLGIATLGYMLVQKAPLTIIPQQLYKGADNFVLMALPLFILAGNLMNTGGITRRIIRLAQALVGHIRGGLALVNVIASMFFAGVSGSAVADTASLGAVLIPSMIEEGYDADFSAAVTACSSTIGIIIPPSIPMVLHGFVSDVSIGELFLAGIIPGILVGGAQMVIAYIISSKRNYPKTSESFSWRVLIDALKDAWMALLLPLIILGFITFGVTTPTEAGAIAVVYALVVGLFCYKELELSDLYEILKESSRTTALIMIIICFSMMLGWALSQQRVPQAITRVVLGMTQEPRTALLLSSALLIVAGCFLHGTALQLIIVPMLLPMVQSLGIDSLLFGMVVVLCVGIGQQTPPVGSALFVTSTLAEKDILEVTRENLPFMMSLVLVLLLVIFFPPICTTIPRFIK
ncbi:MAG: TRAP transporter large permease [Limnochordia bacterium]